MSCVKYNIPYVPIMKSDYGIAKHIGRYRISISHLPFWRKWIEKTFFCNFTDVSKRAHMMYRIAEIILGEGNVDKETLKAIDTVAGQPYAVDVEFLLKRVSKWMWRDAKEKKIHLKNGNIITMNDLSCYICEDGVIEDVSKQIFDLVSECLYYSVPSVLEQDTLHFLKWLQYKICKEQLKKQGKYIPLSCT